jgi:hypothetical protein
VGVDDNGAWHHFLPSAPHSNRPKRTWQSDRGVIGQMERARARERERERERESSHVYARPRVYATYNESTSAGDHRPLLGFRARVPT